MTEERDWLLGPDYVRWLEEHGLERIDAELGATLARRIRGWRKGAKASLEPAEKVLMKLDLMEWQIPDELWTTSPRKPGAGKALTAAEKDEIVRLGELGEHREAIARAIGCSQKTVKKYLDQAGILL